MSSTVLDSTPTYGLWTTTYDPILEECVQTGYSYGLVGGLPVEVQVVYTHPCDGDFDITSAPFLTAVGNAWSLVGYSLP